VNSTLATFTPEASRDLFMNSGDKLTVALHDNANGLVATITDATTGEVGSAARHKRHRRSAPPHPLRVLGSIDDVGRRRPRSPIPVAKHSINLTSSLLELVSCLGFEREFEEA